MIELTREQEMIQKLIRDYAQNEILPKADELDKTGRFPAETVDDLARMGFMGLNIKKEYGGVGLDEVTKVLVIMEIAACCASTAEIYAVHLLVNDIIQRNANEQQKQQFLRQAAEGKLGAFALTEPNAGSDAGSLKTTAVKDGDFYLLNGTKCFISNLGPNEGSHIVVIALTDPAKGAHGGMTAFLVDRNTPGLSVGKTENKMGMNGAAVSELILEDCRVSKDTIMGKVGNGFKIAMSGLDGGRIGIAAQSVGLAQGALKEAIQYGTERKQFGKSLLKNQGLQWYLADMATRTEAARLLTMQAAVKRSKGFPCSKDASMAKYYASENAVYVCDLALQIHGGYGYMKDYPIERMYRDARVLRVYEGTNKIQKTVIARHLTK